MTEKFNAQVVYLIPILVSLLFGMGCAYLLLTQSVTLVNATPFPEDTASGPFGNAFYFVILIAVSATVFYLLLKRKNRRMITLLIAFALTTASLLLSVVYLSAIFSSVPSLEVLVLPFSIIVTVAFDIAIFRLGGKTRNTAVVCIGGALGVFFGASIPFLSALLILGFLAIYDVFAVYYGPVGKIAAHSRLDELPGLSYSFKDIQMGLGDLVFYSMLSGIMLFNFNSPIPCLVSIIGILAGSFITLVILEKKGIFPGLPFPILLGLVGGLLASLV